jgi:hypothetical protein
MSSYTFSIEEMASQLIKVSKFKPKNLIVLDNNSTTKAMYKPRANTSIYTVYYRALNEKMHDNPFVDKYMLDSVEDNNVSLIVDYFIDVKRARSEALENKLIEKLQKLLLRDVSSVETNLWHLARYCEKLKIESWPELQQILETNFRLNEDIDKLNSIAINSTRLSPQEVKKVIEEKLSIKTGFMVALLRLSQTNPENLDNTLKNIFDWLFAIIDLPVIQRNLSVVSELSCHAFLDVIYDCATDKHTENFIKLYSKFISVGFQNITNEDRHSSWLFSTYLSNMEKVFDKTKEHPCWNEAIQKIIDNALTKPYQVLDVCAELKLRLPEDVENKLFEVVTQERVAQFESVLRDCQQESSTWSRLYNMRNFQHESFCVAVTDYIFKCLRNRTKATDNFFMSIKHKGLFEDYIKGLQDLARQGVKLNPI